MTLVASLCAALATEPLYHLSLHSKELFHSNLLAWFCETHPATASRLFATWVPERPDAAVLRVQRERNQLDLAVELPGLAPFVVENKVFAPPDEAQLDRYSSGRLAALDNPTLLLLSLGRPIWDDATYRPPSGPPWRYVSYQQLADVLSEVVDHLGGFDRELLAHYCLFIRTLHDLAEVAGGVRADEPIALDNESAGLLAEIRLHDAMGKLRARSAIATARDRFSAEAPDAPVRWLAGFTNGQPLVEAFVDRGNGDWLGWQYQGGQWRLAVIASRHAGRTIEERDGRHAYVAERYGGWADFGAIPRLTGRTVDAVPPTEAGGGWNGYNPDFVYRYRMLRDLTLNELLTLSHHYLTAAVGWRD